MQGGTILLIVLLGVLALGVGGWIAYTVMRKKAEEARRERRMRQSAARREAHAPAKEPPRQRGALEDDDGTIARRRIETMQKPRYAERAEQAAGRTRHTGSPPQARPADRAVAEPPDTDWYDDALSAGGAYGMDDGYAPSPEPAAQEPADGTGCMRRTAACTHRAAAPRDARGPRTRHAPAREPAAGRHQAPEPAKRGRMSPPPRRAHAPGPWHRMRPARAADGRGPPKFFEKKIDIGFDGAIMAPTRRVVPHDRWKGEADVTQMLSKQYFTFTNRSYFDGFGYFCLAFQILPSMRPSLCAGAG